MAAVLLAGSAVGLVLFVLLASPLGHSLFGGTVSHGALRGALRGVALRSKQKGVAQRLRGAALVEPGKADFGLPVRLKIPTLGVDAAVQNVGLTPDGAMGVPTSPGTVAWFMLGPRPGNKGNAVIDGHSGYGNGVAAVFDDLPSLRKGDMLFVEDARGVQIPFVVRESRTYGRDANASDVFGRSEGRHLNLVTCTGSWDAAAGTHSDRLVVFTDALP